MRYNSRNFGQKDAIMHADIQHALENDSTIDITTTGRKTGRQRRKEIWFHYIDGQIYITGLPGSRDWYANLRANPAFTIHLKESTQADIPATATLITGDAERREIMAKILKKLNQMSQLEEWVAGSPLVHVDLKNEV
ncbi:MAG: nitroreductase family deazaflavin-dependent oxidoreductase [Chloroflexi bacterium]|nr:nitroreductase family deazaflavin-dependent oxidoreductase [Chloroflexota bacterium]